MDFDIDKTKHTSLNKLGDPEFDGNPLENRQRSIRVVTREGIITEGAAINPLRRVAESTQFIPNIENEFAWAR